MSNLYLTTIPIIQNAEKTFRRSRQQLSIPLRHKGSSCKSLTNKYSAHTSCAKLEVRKSFAKLTKGRVTGFSIGY